MGKINENKINAEGCLSTKQKGAARIHATVCGVQLLIAILPPVPRPRPCRERLPEILNTHAAPLADDGRVRVDNITALVGVRVVAPARVKAYRLRG